MVSFHLIKLLVKIRMILSICCFFVNILFSWAIELPLPVEIVDISPTGRYGIIGYTEEEQFFSISKVIKPYVNRWFIYDFLSEDTCTFLPTHKLTLSSPTYIHWFNSNSYIMLIVKEYENIESNTIYKYSVTEKHWEKVKIPDMDTIIDEVKKREEYQNLVEIFGQTKSDSMIASIEDKRIIMGFELLPSENLLVFSYVRLFPSSSYLVSYDLEKHNVIQRTETNNKLILPIGYSRRHKKFIALLDLDTVVLFDTALSILDTIPLNFFEHKGLMTFSFLSDILYLAGKCTDTSIALFTVNLNDKDISKIRLLDTIRVKRIVVNRKGDIIVEYRNEIFAILKKEEMIIKGKDPFWRGTNKVIYVTTDNKEIREIDFSNGCYVEKSKMKFRGFMSTKEN